MDPKRKANFINSVAAGQTVSCPRCGAANRPSDKNCITCGTALVMNKQPDKTPAFASVSTNVNVKYDEPAAVFAEGLPSWDIVPPQIMVRRH